MNPPPTPSSTNRLLVLTVTWNSASEIAEWVQAVGELDYRPLEVVIVDCASKDDSVIIARQAAAESALPIQVVQLSENLGFAGGMNHGLSLSNAEWVLSLNPDARPSAQYAKKLVDLLADHAQAAAATGRLLRAPQGDEPVKIDACGMRLRPTWRHLDRGSGEIDQGQFTTAERVFGGTGAATLFRREALLDVAVDGEIFDSYFHSFREDAELAFRFAERGWSVLYEPRATALHKRYNLPQRRAEMPTAVNFHSLKNRYLLRAYHQTGGNLIRTLIPATMRDLGALAYVLLLERSSLAAYKWLWQHRSAIRERRKKIQGRRTRPNHEVDRWFRKQSLPL